MNRDAKDVKSVVSNIDKNVTVSLPRMFRPEIFVTAGAGIATTLIRRTKTSQLACYA